MGTQADYSARSYHELQNYEQAKQSHDELQRRYPELAAQFSYLRLRGDETEGVAEANGAKELMVWGEEK